MGTTVLKRCLTHAEQATKKEVEGGQAKLAEIDTTIAQARETIKNLFAFEQGAKPAILARIKALEYERLRIQNLISFSGYGRLDLEPLKWRDKKTGWPLLVILTLNSSRFELKASYTRREVWRDGGFYSDGYYATRKVFSKKIFPALPKVIIACYADVLDRLGESAKSKRKSVALVAEYVGGVPATARAKILEAKKQFPKGLFLITEAKRWVKKEKRGKKGKTAATPNQGDLLVVGWDGTDLWVIDSFNLTPIEYLVETEFSADAPAKRPSKKSEGQSAQKKHEPRAARSQPHRPVQSWEM